MKLTSRIKKTNILIVHNPGNSPEYLVSQLGADGIYRSIQEFEFEHEARQFAAAMRVNERLAVAIFGEKAAYQGFCSLCEEKRLHTASECGRRIGTNA